MPARPRSRRTGSDRSDAIAEPPEKVVVGRILHRGRLQSAEIGIDGAGRISRIARSISGGERFDFGEQILLPAATDLHVHLREPPGDSGVESLATGTLQAAYGGVALVTDMPNTDPPVDSEERVDSKRGRARGRLAVDLLIVAAARSPSQVRSTARAAGAFKLFRSPTTGITEVPGTEELPGLLRAVADSGLALAVHAEDPGRFGELASTQSPAEWDKARPPASEESAIRSTIAAAPSDLRLHFAHLTSADAVEIVRGAGHSGEVTPHHLLLSDDARGGWTKVNPPLRDEATRLGLAAAFRSGRIPCLASDHAPHPVSEKSKPFGVAPGGMPNLETMLPLLLDQVRRGDLPLAVLLAAAADRPARWLGVPLGRIAVGHRADLLVVDFREKRTIAAKRLHAPVGWTPYEGFPAVFPRHHLRAGEPIVQEFEYVGGAHGLVVRPEYAR